MGINFISNLNILIAGDENGQIWCYDISELVNGAKETDDANIFPVDGILPFPAVYQGGVLVEELKDSNNNVTKTGEKGHKYAKSKHINMLTVNKTASLLVAACNCNILCLYKPHENLIIPEDSESEDSGSENELEAGTQNS